jgi:ferrous iron transport protein B
VVGTPNAGKTTIVNALAGARLQVGNWAGTTVELQTARLRLPCGAVDLVDLPGTYSLAGTASDEEIVRPALEADPGALVLNVVDAVHLERDLTLTLELTELGRTLVVALNNADTADARGAPVDPAALERSLGVPVVSVTPHAAGGVAALVAAAGRAQPSTFTVRYPEPLTRRATRLAARFATPWHALATLTGEAAAWGAQAGPDAGDAYLSVTAARQRAAAELARRAIGHGPARADLTTRIDTVLLHPLVGPVAAIAGLAMAFHLTFTVADPFVALLAHGQAVLAAWTLSLPWPPLVASFVAEALLGGVGTVASFVPLLFTLYAVLAFLENAGVLPRLAAVADALMRLAGLPGRAVLPMVLSLGCTVPAVGSTRLLSDGGDRRRVALALPSIPCSARLPVLVVMAGAVAPRHAAFVVTGLYALGFLTAIGSALLFRHVVGTHTASSAMELPVYRLPPLRLVLRLASARTRAFVTGAGGPILVAVTVVWALLTLPGPSGTSLYETVARTVAPLFGPLGFGDWRVVGALIPGMVAKEVVVGTLALTLVTDAAAPLAIAERLGAILDPAAAAALVVFTLLYVPCVATLAAIRRAFGLRLALLSVAHQTAVAYGAAWLTFTIAR